MCRPIYQRFLAALDGDLRDACMGNCSAREPLPYPYRGAKDSERMAHALLGVLESCAPAVPWTMPERRRDDVRAACEAIAAGAIALLAEFFPADDNCLSGVACVIGMFQHRDAQGFQSSGDLLFRQVTTGMRYSPEKATNVPSDLIRASDGVKPSRKHRDGTRGFTADEDDAAMFYERYREIRDRVLKASPRFDFELCVKRPFEPLSDNLSNFYSLEEKMTVDFDKRVQELQDRYTTNIVRAKGYDLLDTLMIQALLEYLRDTAAPLAARESYLAQTECLIGDVVELPHIEGRDRGHGKGRNRDGRQDRVA